MNKNISQKGQAIILIAFAIVGLVGFAALAIDGGRALSDKRHAQNAADTSAFAAALAKIQGNDYEAAAVNRAASNGYNNGANPNGSTSIIEVNLCSETGITCQGMPTGADPDEYIRVKITSTINTSFARVLGRPQVTTAAEAIAHASSVNSNPLVLGAALAAFRKDGTPFTGHGGGDLNVYGSGVYSNSTDTDCPNGAMKLSGSITYHVDTAFASAGQVCTNGGPVLEGPEQEGMAQIDKPHFEIAAPSFTCGPAPSPQLIGNEYQPGTYNGLNPLPGNYTFAPGNYCFNANVKFNGGGITAHNVNFRMNSGSFTVSGTTVFTCSNMIVHVDGGSGVAMTGGGNNCTGITFYLETGNVQLNGNTTNIFTAPTSGPYKGLLIYLPESNTSSITITGTSNSQYTGSIIGVSSAVTINGNSDSAGYNVQVLADTVDLGGTSNINIHYNPNDLYNPPQYPTIQLIK